jgi:hypothetical protein
MIWCFRRPEHAVLGAVYLLNTDAWTRARQLNWEEVEWKNFPRRFLFGTGAYQWVVGSCPTVECTAEVLRTAWNTCGNESVIIVLADDEDTGKLMRETFKDDLEAIDDNELTWIERCPTVFSRAHDGTYFRIYSVEETKDELRATLDSHLRDSGEQFRYAAEPL